MSEKFSSGTINPKQTNKLTSLWAKIGRDNKKNKKKDLESIVKKVFREKIVLQETINDNACTLQELHLRMDGQNKTVATKNPFFFTGPWLGLNERTKYF